MQGKRYTDVYPILGNDFTGSHLRLFIGLAINIPVDFVETGLILDFEGCCGIDFLGKSEGKRLDVCTFVWVLLKWNVLGFFNKSTRVSWISLLN